MRRGRARRERGRDREKKLRASCMRAQRKSCRVKPREFEGEIALRYRPFTRSCDMVFSRPGAETEPERRDIVWHRTHVRKERGLHVERSKEVRAKRRAWTEREIE